MTTPNGLSTPGQEDYGLGTFIESGSENKSEYKFFGHTGGIGGDATYAYYLREPGRYAHRHVELEADRSRGRLPHGWAAVLGVDYP